VPESHLLDLAYRDGGKARFETATTCRFLVEAPPLRNGDRSGTKHGQTEFQLTGSCMRKAEFPQQLHIYPILPRSRYRPLPT